MSRKPMPASAILKLFQGAEISHVADVCPEQNRPTGLKAFAKLFNASPHERDQSTRRTAWRERARTAASAWG